MPGLPSRPLSIVFCHWCWIVEAPGRAEDLTAVRARALSGTDWTEGKRVSGVIQKMGGKDNKNLEWSLVVRILFRPVEPFVLG